jgi:tetratricopeptide (TPR) repeat protein
MTDTLPTSDTARALLAQGLAHRAEGRLDAALETLSRAARAEPYPLEAFTEAGVTAAQLRRFDEAAGWFRAGIEAWPQRYEPYYFEGVLLANQNRHNEAVIRFEKALTLPPLNVEVLRGLVGSLRRAGRLDEAEAFAIAWEDTFPQDADGPAALAHVLMEAERLEEALAAARRARALAPGSAWRILEARILLLLGDTPGAIAELQAARTADPDNAAVYLHLGTALKAAGQFDQARAALGTAAQRNPRDPEIYAALADITRFAPDDPLLAAMDRLAGEAQRQPGGVPRKLHFALGKAWDDAGDPDKAFHHFAAANADLARHVPYNEAATLALMERLKALFTAETIARLAAAGSQSERPVFIVGLPQSGIALVEQILAGHPDVAAPGETRALPQAADAALGLSAGFTATGLSQDAAAQMAAGYLARMEPSANGKPRLLDTLPANALLAGLIHAILPRARILHCRRDPMDVGLSCFAASYGERMPFTTELGALGRYIRAHEALMAHWRAVLPAERFIAVDYEAVAADPEGQARRIVAACGLGWDARCLAFHIRARTVNAAGGTQGREPLPDRSIGRWRAYEKPLAPLRQALGLAP